MIALTINAYSQKLVKEYYDWAKTKIMREYYSDAYGTLNGSYKAYSEYGGIMKQGQCKDNGPIGKWIENYDNGKLHYIKIYDTPGTYDFQVKDGKIISYYEDGKTIKYERNFKNLELDGVWKEYDEKGIITKEGMYVNGIFEPTGITKIKYEEEQEKQKQLEAETLLKKADEYKKIIPEADKAFIAKEYVKALQLYKSASDLLVNEKYPKDKISGMVETFHSNSKFFNEYIDNQYDSLGQEFEKQINEYKSVILQKIAGSDYSEDLIEAEYRPCWDNINWQAAKPCFDRYKRVYESYIIAFCEGYFNYSEALSIEKSNINKSGTYFSFEGVNNGFYTYDKDTFLNNLKEPRNNYELAKSGKSLYDKVIEKKKQIESLNDQNKKKTLLKKYLIVYNDLIVKYNAYTSIAETIRVLNTLSTICDKVISYYSEDTYELESKLKDVKTSEQIQTVFLGQ